MHRHDVHMVALTIPNASAAYMDLVEPEQSRHYHARMRKWKRRVPASHEQGKGKGT